MTAPTFDINAAIQALREGQDLTGKDGILTPLIKQLTEAALNTELENMKKKVLSMWGRVMLSRILIIETRNDQLKYNVGISTPTL